MRFAAAVAVLVALAACARASAPTSSNAPITLDPRPPLPGANAELGISWVPGAASPKLDLYRSKKGKAPYPVVIRFGAGAEGQAAAAITDAGYAIAVVHLPPDATLLAGARQAKAAVRFLRANAAKYELDPDRFIAWGNADGGWFAVMLGVTGDQATTFDDPALGNAGTSSAVQVVIDWGGPTDFRSLDADERSHPSPACSQTYQRHGLAGTKESQWVCGDKTTALTDPPCANAVRDADLASYVPTAKKLPAFYFAHGADDCVVSLWQSVRVLEALKKRDEQPGFHRMSRAGREDPRFDQEETARSLAFIQEAFHPEAGAKAE
jgi:acetyl esterase/lipase